MGRRLVDEKKEEEKRRKVEIMRRFIKCEDEFLERQDQKIKIKK
jgi:hypothetical protein